MRRRQIRLYPVPTVISDSEADRLIAERHAKYELSPSDRISQEIEAARDRLSIQHLLYIPVESEDRSSVCETEGRAFESRRGYQFNLLRVAQSG